MSNWLLWLASPSTARAAMAFLMSGLFLCGVLVIYLPIYIDNAAQKKAMPGLVQELQALKEKLRVSEIVGKNQAAINTIGKRLHQEIRQNDIVDKLSRFTTSPDITLTEQSFLNLKSSGGVSQYRQSLVLTGTYGEIRRILTPLRQDMPGLTIISRVSLATDSERKIVAHVDVDSYSVVVP